MLHWELWNNRQGEQSTSPDVAPLLPLSRPFAERVENLCPSGTFAAQKRACQLDGNGSLDGGFWAERTEAGERFGVVDRPEPITTTRSAGGSGLSGTGL